MPVFALDLDSTVNDKARKNYTKSQTTVQQQNQTNIEPKIEITPKQESTKPVQFTQPQPAQQLNPIQDNQPSATTQIIEKKLLPNVPALPKNVNSSTVAPINTQYSGKMPNSSSIIPCTDIKVGDLIIDETIYKTKPAIVVSTKQKQTTQTPTTKTATKTTYRYVILPKGTQIRATNTTKIVDTMYEGQTITFITTQEVHTPYLTIPAKTKLTARVIDAHRPQMSCNGGLVAFRIISAQINGYNQPIDAGIIKIKTDKIHFGNLKGEHTYWKTTCKKAKWGQKIFKKWAKTSTKLASNGPAVILSPFPYIGGAVTAAASTISSPITALLGKGGNLVIPANTVFTIKIYDDAKIRY